MAYRFFSKFKFQKIDPNFLDYQGEKIKLKELLKNFLNSISL